MNRETYLQKTVILNYDHPAIESLVKNRDWENLSRYDKISAVYAFVKDEIAFGYNAGDDIPASRVLEDGYGQCNTKGSLLMGLLRRVGIPCRFHGFTIDNILQKGAIPGYLIRLAPKYIIHSWVEVYFDKRWINLEGFILDKRYLNAVQKKFSSVKNAFCGYAIATDCLENPEVEWSGTDTYIQKEGIRDDFGIFDDPDTFYRQNGTNLSGFRKILFTHLFRHVINRNVRALRSG